MSRMLFSFAVLVAVSCLVTNAFQPKAAMIASKQRLAASNIEELTKSSSVTSLNSIFESIDGPGHVGSQPMSTAAEARIELAKIIVSMAITALTVKIKLEQMSNALSGVVPPTDTAAALAAPALSEATNKGVLASGIVFQDVIAGTGPALSTGDPVWMEAEVVFNSLPIRNPATSIMRKKEETTFGSSEAAQKVFGAMRMGSSANKSSRSSARSMQAAMAGMRRGTTRKV